VLHDAIASQKLQTENENYCKHARASANLLTAGIKAVIIEEIRADAQQKAKMMNGANVKASSSLEGRTFESAYNEMNNLMMGDKKITNGIRVLKHARAINHNPRLIKMRFKKYYVNSGGSIVNSASGGASESENVGRRKNSKKSKRRKSNESNETTKQSSDSDNDNHNDNHNDNDNDNDNNDGDNANEVSDDSSSNFDEFGEGSWEPKKPEETQETLTSKIFLTYKGGFMHKQKKRLDMSLLKSVKKGVQTEVLQRSSDNKYRQHAFLSLEFDGDFERTFDLECVDGNVELRDKLLHAFKYILLRNEDMKKHLDSWDLDER